MWQSQQLITFDVLPNSGELPFDISKHPACRHAEKSLSRWSEERAIEGWGSLQKRFIGVPDSKCFTNQGGSNLLIVKCFL